MTRHKPKYESSYLGRYLNPQMLRKEVRVLVGLIGAGPEFDAIAFSGSSGCLIAVPIAARMKKPMILVRKRGVDSHTKERVEGDKAARRYIIIDDLISTGATINRIQEEVHAWSGAQCVAIYTAQEGRESEVYIENYEPAADAITARDYVVAVNAADDIPF